ncbi:MAG: DNA-protecting protein DprA [Chloroflexi bacterium]|jgi:DNA processing protein|nr:DNA-protecting protein DprA [Chloroflexota bacterium]
MAEEKYWLGFNLVKGVGPAKVQALLNQFGDLRSAWGAQKDQLRRIGFDQRSIDSFFEKRKELDLDQCLANVQAIGVTLLTWKSEEYPNYLREIEGSPPLIYVHGSLEEIDRWAVAVVGTRRLTSYGRQITQELVAGLVLNGVTIVSGLARGIDAVAHKTALEHGGRTIAVLGSGPDCIYPPENRALARQIVNGRGAIVSEYGLGVQPEAKNFPPRNRIISGLSLGVIVVEAGDRSGASITARFALEQGREVFAVPGNITSPASKGTNRLIQQGAKLVTGVDDVLEELNLAMVLEHSAVQLSLPETQDEAALYEYLSAQPVHIDDLSRSTGLSSSLVSSTLTLMELKGMVRQVGGMNYVLAREPEPIYDIDGTEDTKEKT